MCRPPSKQHLFFSLEISLGLIVSKVPRFKPGTARSSTVPLSYNRCSSDRSLLGAVENASMSKSSSQTMSAMASAKLNVPRMVRTMAPIFLKGVNHRLSIFWLASFSRSAPLFSVQVFPLTLPQMAAWIFPLLLCATRNRTHIRRVATFIRDLSQDALPDELSRPRHHRLS